MSEHTQRETVRAPETPDSKGSEKTPQETVDQLLAELAAAIEADPSIPRIIQNIRDYFPTVGLQPLLRLFVRLWDDCCELDSRQDLTLNLLLPFDLEKHIKEDGVEDAAERLS